MPDTIITDGILCLKGDWKYIKEFNQAPGWAKSRTGKYLPIGYIEMLFNLKEDVAEQTNLATENLDKLAELRKEYEQWRGETVNRHKHHKITKVDADWFLFCFFVKI
jgi:arylsulfatase A-like enzyme